RRHTRSKRDWSSDVCSSDLKPFTIDVYSARKIFELAKQYDTPVTGCSPLRYDQSLDASLKDTSEGSIKGADCFGPMDLQPTQPRSEERRVGKECRYRW